MKTIFVPFLFLATAALSFAQAPDTLWTRTYGRTYSLMGVHCVQQTLDGGYVASGYVGQGEWRTNLALIKTDPLGNLEWTRTYGGGENDYVSLVSSVKETRDHGFVACTSIRVYFPAQEWFLLLVRTDSLGNILWQRTYPGAVWDSDWSVCETADSAFVVAGKGTPAIRKLDCNGDPVWSRNLEGAIKEMQPTTDGGYVIAGTSNGFMLVKLDSAGLVSWSQHFGGQGEQCFSVAQTADGGYVLAGSTLTYGGAYFDFWLVKTDQAGNMTWAPAYGGEDYEQSWSVRQARDGGYVAVGWSNSFDGGDDDVYIIKVDGNGNLLWSRVLGGNMPDAGCSVEQTKDGGYIVAGYTESFGADWRNAYFMRFAPDGWARAFVQLISPGPPAWGYRLVHVQGTVTSLAFTNFCPGTIGSLSGSAATRWAMLPNGDSNNGDSIIFVASTPLTSGTIDTFWLSHPSCANQVTWTVGDSSGSVDGPLPVELAAFDALSSSSGIHLSFSTASETNNDFFEIMRCMSEAGEFNRITTLPSQGNSATGHHYEYLDREVTAGQTYWYYLADVDLNGNRTEHRELMRSATMTGSVELPLDYSLSAYPNPFNPSTTISFALPEADVVRIAVFDVAGRWVQTLVNEERGAGNHTVSFDARDLPSGVYFARMESGRFAMTRKMALIR